MSDKPSITSEVGTVATKYAVGPGFAFFGVVTLNDLALLAGLFCSVVISAYQLWKWWCEYHDRKAKRAAS
jgi:hypothetical protein